MTTHHHITCITKSGGHYNTHEHITAIGSSDEGKTWTRDRAIQLIEAGTDSFYVKVNGDRSTVGVVYPLDGRHPYLRTHADGKWDDNLLSLDDC